MSDLQLIKNKIYEEEKIEEILEHLGCWNIKTEQNGKIYTAGLPNGDNSRSVQVKNNEYLNVDVRSKGIKGDIYTLISYIIYECETDSELQGCINRSKYWLCNRLEYYEYIDEFYKLLVKQDQKPTGNYNKWLTKLKKKRFKNEIENYNEVLTEKILKRYIIQPHLHWINEGINYNTQVYFQIGFDIRGERIVFPIHNSKGDLIGVKGRYIGNNKEILDNCKYLYVVPCNKSIELFNLHRALPYIKEQKEVLVVEGAKTVMMLHQWGYKNAVSIEGDSLTLQQVKLLKDLGIEIKLTFLWDKDKGVEFIKKQICQINGRIMYVVFDKGLLDGKDSPCDKGKEVFEELMSKNKYKVGFIK